MQNLTLEVRLVHYRGPDLGKALHREQSVARRVVSGARGWCQALRVVSGARN